MAWILLIISFLIFNISHTVSKEFQQLTTKINYTLAFLNLNNNNINKKIILISFISKDNILYQDQIFLKNTQLAIIKKFRNTLFSNKLEKIIIEVDPVIFLLYLNYLNTGKFIDFRYILKNHKIKSKKIDDYFVFIYLNLISFINNFDNFENIFDQWRHSAQKNYSKKNQQHPLRYYITQQEVKKLFSQQLQEFLSHLLGQKNLQKITKQIKKNKLFFEPGFYKF